MKKRIIALLLCIAMMVSMVGCVGVSIVPKQLSDSEQEPAEQVTPTPVVSETPAPTEEPTPTPVVSEEPTPSPVVSPDAGVAVISEEGDDTSGETGITLTAVPAGVTPVEESLGTQIAYVANNTVTVYEYYENGALGMVITDAKGDQIELTKKFTYTVDGVDTVIYHYAASDYESAIGAADDANYQFILASDVTFTAEEVEPTPTPTPSLTPTDKTDDATGVAISANLPADVTLDVAAKILAESGLDTTAYPVTGASLFYDVTLLQSGTEYQPTEGITITFPESAITNSGLAAGDWYKVYHIHDGVTDVTGPFQYNGGAIEASFNSLSVVGIAESETPIDLLGQHGGSYEESDYFATSIIATIKNDPVVFYGSLDSTVYTATINGAVGEQIELVKSITYADGFVLYRAEYYGTNSELTDAISNYYFISSEDINLICSCCENCTGAAGCTCGCESCTCNDSGTLVLTDPTTGIMVSGVLPAGTQLKVTDATTSTIPGLTVSHLQYKTEIYNGYNISLLDADGNPLADDAFDTVTVYVPDVWNTSYSDPIVDVYHLNDDGTLGELLTTRNGSVGLTDDGGVEIEVSSFSDYWFVSGDTDSNIYVTRGNHTIYIAPGTTGTLTVQSTNSVSLNNNAPPSGVTVAKNSSSQGETSFTITAASSAEIGTTGSFQITWKDGGQNRIANYTIKVVSAEEANKQAFVGNTISHIQIDIECSAVVLGYNNDQSTAIDLNYSQSNSTNRLTKVLDDSAVGFHYELTYTVDGVETTVIVRVDESATNLPTGVEYSDIAEQWTVTGITTEDGQISFNGTIPVGTKTNPVVYSVTVNSTFNLVPNNGTTAEAVDVSISNSLGYWYTTNECPGLDHSTTDWEAGSVISNSGIDLSKFTMGSVLGETTYYVVFSNLTKVVNGYTFGTGETKNYVFTIYRDLLVDDTTTTDKNEAEVVEWVAFDTISITADGATSSTNFTTDATKYSVDNITKYQYKIVETGYSISGYGCTNQIEVKSGDSYTVSSDGVFAFSTTQSADGKTVTYSAEIKCTNTYTEAGLTVNKVVTNAPESAANDEFTVKVWPNQLSTTGVDTDNMYTYFNTGTYKVDGTVLPVTDSTSTTAYGYITLTIKAGESKTITGLPAGTYYVQEQAGTNTNYNYDTVQKSANLTSGSASVTITNEYKIGSLTITKTVDGLSEEVKNGQSYEFTVSGQTEKIVLNQANNWTHTIENLVADDYTITETTPQIEVSTGYRYVDTNITGDVKDVGSLSATAVVPAGDTAEVTFTNNYVELGSLTIEKCLTGGIGAAMQEYTFTISGSDENDFAFTTQEIKLGGNWTHVVQGVTQTKMTHTISNLLPGTYIITEVMPEDEDDYKYVSTGNKVDDKEEVIGREATVVVGAGDHVVIFTNNFVGLGNLTVSKKVVEAENASYVIDKDQSFTFVIDFSDEEAHAYTGSYNGTITDQGTITLKHGESVTFAKLPNELEYLITETAVDGFTTTATGEKVEDKVEGKVVSGTITTGETDTAAFTNTYSTELGDLEITKTISHKDYDKHEGGTFEFTVVGVTDAQPGTYNVTIGGVAAQAIVTAGDDGNTVAIRSEDKVTVTLTAEQDTNTVEIAGLPVGNYTVTEIDDEIQNYDFDTTPKNTAVAANVNGAVAVTNSYPRQTEKLTITKTLVNGSTRNVTDTFTFKVTMPSDVNYDDYASELKVTTGYNLTRVGDREFTVAIPVTAAMGSESSVTVTIENLPTGDYTVAEIDIQTGYTTDIDAATEGDQTSVVVQVKDKQSASVTCTNTVITGTLTITKAVPKGLHGAGDSFLFTVTADNGFSKEVVIAGAGSVVLTDLPLGTYTVVEDTAWSWRYSCDEASKSVSITASDPNRSVSFSNSFDNNKWLSDSSYVMNTFGAGFSSVHK